MKNAPGLVEPLELNFTLQNWCSCQALLTVTPFLLEKFIHPCD